ARGRPAALDLDRRRERHPSEQAEHAVGQRAQPLRRRRALDLLPAPAFVPHGTEVEPRPAHDVRARVRGRQLGDGPRRASHPDEIAGAAEGEDGEARTHPELARIAHPPPLPPSPPPPPTPPPPLVSTPAPPAAALRPPPRPSPNRPPARPRPRPSTRSPPACRSQARARPRGPPPPTPRWRPAASRGSADSGRPRRASAP